MSDELFDMPKPPARPLDSIEMARLRAAGADENTIAACERVTNRKARCLLVACFCDAAPNNWHKLRCMIALLLWRRATGRTKPIGGDVLTNTVKGIFDDCGGNNTHRLIFTRLVAIVRPDLRPILDFHDGGDSEANAVLESGWAPPATVDWHAIPAANLGDVTP